MKLNRRQIFHTTVSIPLFVGHGFCYIFGLEASFWPRFSRKVLSYVGNLHLNFREVWSYGSEFMKNFVHGCYKARVWRSCEYFEYISRSVKNLWLKFGAVVTSSTSVLLVKFEFV